MYRLELTRDERRAIDHIGRSYAHGDDLFRLLWGNCQKYPDIDWDASATIIFEVPEHIAWQIRDMGEACCYNWDCFADELSLKLTEFCMNVV